MISVKCCLWIIVNNDALEVCCYDYLNLDKHPLNNSQLIRLNETVRILYQTIPNNMLL